MMTREAALDALAASDSDLRLRAARVLANRALPVDEGALRARRRVESVPWIRAALEQALARLASTSPTATAEVDEGETDGPDPRADYTVGLQLATDRLVHEVRSVVGTLRYWAQKENPDFAGSETERQVGRLRRCVEAIDLLGKVARSPSSEEFDLAQLIDDEIAALGELDAPIEQVGRRPFLVLGDSGVLALVVRNALSNALEAAGESEPAVHVSWGEAPNEYWVAVFDRGPGLPRDPEALFDFGSSTKLEHVGAGLAIVAQAAVALEGDVTLSEEVDGTTKFEFRWRRPDGVASAASSG